MEKQSKERVTLLDNRKADSYRIKARVSTELKRYRFWLGGKPVYYSQPAYQQVARAMVELLEQLPIEMEIEVYEWHCWEDIDLLRKQVEAYKEENNYEYEELL